MRRWQTYVDGLISSSSRWPASGKLSGGSTSLAAWQRAMTTFDDRERQEETKWKHDQELGFKVRNRRNKLLGLYVAELLGLKGDEADAYAKEVVMADFEEPGDDDVVRKILADIEGKPIDLDAEDIREKMAMLEETALKQIKAE